MPPDPLDRVENRLDQLDARVITLGESLATMNETLRFLVKLEGRLELLQKDLQEANHVIRHNKMVIDAIKSSIYLVIPVSLTLLGAIFLETLK
jgi:hypothetical protein